MADLGGTVRRCPLVSMVIGGDCYSLRYSPFAMPIKWSRLQVLVAPLNLHVRVLRSTMVVSWGSRVLAGQTVRMP